MVLTRTYAVFLRHLYLFRSNPTRLSSVFLWLVVDIIQWGFISKYLGSFGKSTFGFLTVILGAIVLWGFMTRIQQGIMTSFLEDIWSQNFINYFASPLRIIEYLSGLVFTSIATGLLGFAMGILVSGVIFRLGPAAEWLGWPIPLVLSIFSGVYYPISTLPVPFRVISRVIPASYVFERMRNVLVSPVPAAGAGLNLLVGETIALAYLALAYAFFIKIYRRNLENGAIAKFSAET